MYYFVFYFQSVAVHPHFSKGANQIVTGTDNKVSNIIYVNMHALSTTIICNVWMYVRPRNLFIYSVSWCTSGFHVY